MISIAFVGAGPTAIYTLQALVTKLDQPIAIMIFEEQNSLGRGTPYRPGWNDPAMLSNIASIEIPPIEQSLVDWLKEQSDATLDDLGIVRAKIGERTFYPRIVLGEYFHCQVMALLKRAQKRGFQITVRTKCRVVDAVSEESGMTLVTKSRSGQTTREKFDHVVIATGHQWPSAPEIRPGYFLSPWPASALAGTPPCKVGIRGTSLTAIDATVALAVTHGEFVEHKGTLNYVPNPGTENFHMIMMSRKGLLPEADFYAPLPYTPLSICTPEAIDGLIRDEAISLLEGAFSLFKRELALSDPEYAAKISLETLGLEEFHDQYFAQRAECDPFDWAERNLREAEFNYATETTVAWRYAILRMHEVIEKLVPYLEGRDYQRFSRYFKPVFVDDYATVPHKSIRRMLALHRASKLDVIAVGDNYRIDSHRAEGGAIVEMKDESLTFPVFIEAMGQKALPAKEFPFPSLLRQGIIHDEPSSREGENSRGIAIDDEYHPVSDAIPPDQLFCLSLPFILGRHPFHQGITSSYDMGNVVADRLAEVIKNADAKCEGVPA